VVLPKLRTHAFVTLVGISLILGIISNLPGIALALGFGEDQLFAGIDELSPRIALVFGTDGGTRLPGVVGEEAQR